MDVIEGTWEEIERRKEELIGRYLRVIITPERPAVLDAPEKLPVEAEPKKLRAFGMLAGVLSTEEYLREKREDTLREDRSL